MVGSDGGDDDHDVKTLMIASNVEADEAKDAFIVALSELIAARQDLSIALTFFIDSADASWSTSSSSQALAAVASTVGVSLLFVPVTALAGAITLISGAGIGALATGGEALATKSNDDEIQWRLAKDEKAELCFQQAWSRLGQVLDMSSFASSSTARSKSLIWHSSLHLQPPSEKLVSLSHASWHATLSPTREAAEKLRSRLQVSLNVLCSLACDLATSKAEPEKHLVTLPADLPKFEVVDDCLSLAVALTSFMQKRRLLADWLVSYVDHFNTSWLASAGSKTAAALTTVTGIVLFFVPVTTVAGAICLTSGVSLGAVSSGGEAVASSISRDRLQSLMYDDEQSFASFQRHLSRVLLGRCRSDGKNLDPTVPAHMWELRGIEQWSRDWFQGPSCQAGPISDSSSQKDVARRLHQNLSDTLEQLEALDSFLRDSDSGVVGSLAFGQQSRLSPTGFMGDVDAVAASSFAALNQTLDQLIQKRAHFIVQLQELAQSSVANRLVANSSKTVTALGSATGAVLFLCPPTMLAGLITFVASGVTNGMINGTENIVNRQTMQKLQQCCDDDREAELAFDQRLRRALQSTEEESLSAQLVTVLGAWAGEAGRSLARHHAEVWDSDAVLQDAFLSLKGFYAPLDCVYSWAHASITERSVQQICQDVIASQEKLLDLRRRLSDVALKTIPPVADSLMRDDSDPASSGSSQLREVLQCLDELLEDVEPPIDLMADELPELLLELTDDLMQKRQTLVTWLDDWHSAISANRLTRESSRVICVVGTITGVVLTFVPATAIAGGIVTGSCGGTEAFLW